MFKILQLIFMFEIFEDKGLSEREFAAAQEKLQKQVLAEAGRERQQEARLYFEFDTAGMRDEAMKLLNQLRADRHEYDEAFRYFEGVSIDPQRPDVGLEIRFNKNPRDLRATFEKLLEEQGIMPKEEYKTVGGESRPEETTIYK